MNLAGRVGAARKCFDVGRHAWYAGLMSRQRMIQVENPEADEARPESIAMIAIAALGVGLVLTLGLARFMPSGAAEVTATRAAAARVARAQLPVASAIPTRSVSATRGLPPPTSAAVEKPAARSADVAAKQTPPAATSTPIVAKPAPPTAAAAPIAAKPAPPTAAVVAPIAAKPAPAVASAVTPPAAAPTKAAPGNPQPSASSSTNSAKRRTPKYEFEQGVFAYVRCDGEERRGARFPCPRDRKLEELVWSTLESLTTCETDPGRGSAEVRLTLRKDKIHGVEWKPSTSGPSLNLRAVAKCAGAKLADARTRLKAPEGLVSFRFSLK